MAIVEPHRHVLEADLPADEDVPGLAKMEGSMSPLGSEMEAVGLLCCMDAAVAALAYPDALAVVHVPDHTASAVHTYG